MKIRFITLTASILVLTVSLVSATLRQGLTSAATQEHQALKQWEGSWELEVFDINKLKNGKLPRKNKKGDYGSMFEANLTCDGLWLALDFETDKRSWDYKAHSVLGFSREKEAYQATWFDSLSTQVATFGGPALKGGDRFVLYGAAPDVDDPGLQASYKLTIIFDGKNSTVELARERKDKPRTYDALYLGRMTKQK